MTSTKASVKLKVNTSRKTPDPLNGEQLSRRLLFTSWLMFICGLLAFVKYYPLVSDLTVIYIIMSCALVNFWRDPTAETGQNFALITSTITIMYHLFVAYDELHNDMQIYGMTYILAFCGNVLALYCVGLYYNIKNQPDSATKFLSGSYLSCIFWNFFLYSVLFQVRNHDKI